MNANSAAGRAAAIAVWMLAAATTMLAQAGKLAPFIATPHDVVDRMLVLADVQPEDVVYDIGSGDGRIVIAAARDFGARGVGIDIDPTMVQQAKANAEAAGVADRTRFVVADAMTADVSEASVITLYMLASSNERLRARFTRQLDTGARIVSHAFAMGDWAPRLVHRFEDEQGFLRTLLLWVHDGIERP